MKRQEISDAIKDVLPVLLAVIPFGAVFGALAVERGLPVPEVLFASATIFAGASQYAMLDLMGQKVPAWAIVLAVFAINFRHVLYSAAVGRKMGAFHLWQKALVLFLLVDPLYAASEARARTDVLKPAYVFTYGVIIYCTWMSSNLVGVLFGRLIENPAAFGFDFVLPIYFVGLVMGFRKATNFLPVLIVSVAVSILVWLTLGTPWHISLGGFAGLLTAAALSKPTRNAETDGKVTARV